MEEFISDITKLFMIKNCCCNENTRKYYYNRSKR